MRLSRIALSLAAALVTIGACLSSTNLSADDQPDDLAEAPLDDGIGTSPAAPDAAVAPAE